MGSLEKDNLPSQPISKDVPEESHFDDEISLIDYFRVVWKHKYLILLGSVLPALLVALILFSWPRKFKTTYVYDVIDQGIHDVSNWSLDEKNYNVLLDRFYSGENVNKIVSKLRENGLDRYAELMNRAGGKEDLKKLVDFEVLPPYIDLSKVNVLEPAKLGHIRGLKAQLLYMTITARGKNDIPKIGSVIRDNFENVVPVYSIAQSIINAIREYKARMAGVEENRFSHELALKTNKLILGKLKNIKTETSDKTEGNVILQFDVGGKSEYLPLAYQIQAAESKIVELEENIRANQEKYNHYKDLLALNEKLFSELKNNAASHHTIHQVHSCLADLIDSCKTEELRDYLSSYIKKIENRISANIPVVEKPKVCPAPRSTAKKSVIVFAICLMVSTFAAFLSEGSRKSEAQAS